MKFRIIVLIFIALLSELIDLAFFKDINMVRFLSYLVSILFILFLKYRLNNQNVYFLFQITFFLLVGIWYFPNILFFTKSDNVVVVFTLSLIGLLLNLFNRTRNLITTTLLISIMILIGIITGVKTLVAAILFFPILMLVKRFVFKNLLNYPFHFYLIIPLLVICLVFIIGSEFPQVRVLGARDYMWANVIFGEEFAQKYFYNSFSAYSNIKLGHLSQNNVHNLFVGTLSRFNLLTGILNLFIVAIIINSTFKKLLFNNWRVQFSMFVLILFGMFSGRSLLSIDDMTVIWWVSVFGLTKYSTKKNLFLN